MSEPIQSLNPEQLHDWFLALEERVRALRVEIAEKQVELARQDEQLSLVRRLLELQNGKNPLADPPETSRQEQTDPRASKPGDLESAVEDILRTSGSPLHISVIRSQLIQRGVPIPGRGDDANIIVRISQLDDRFTRTARGTYALAEWDMPALPRVARGKRAKVRRK